MDDKIAILVTNSEFEEPSLAYSLKAFRFKITIPRKPTIELIVQRSPDLICIDWSPSSVDTNVGLVKAIRSTAATRQIPILVSYSDKGDLPDELWRVERLIPLSMPYQLEEFERALHRVSDGTLPSRVLVTTTADTIPPTVTATAPVANTPTEHDTWLLDRVRTVCGHFKEIVAPLLRRRTGKAVLELSDEYDVQDALHVALLSITDNVRPEEPGPSFAGAGSLQDFHLPSIKTIVEVKRIRDSNHGRRGVADELLVDKARYGKREECARLICLVFDPDRHIPNVAIFKSDLESEPRVPSIEVYVVR
jgi:hypothetical protein